MRSISAFSTTVSSTQLSCFVYILVTDLEVQVHVKYAVAVVNVVFDIYILTLPLRLFRRYNWQ